MTLTIAAALAAGCGKRSSPPAAGSNAEAGSPPDAPPAAVTPSTNEYAAVIPAAPRRDSPPPSLATSALAVGAAVPAIDMLATTGRFVLADALTKHARVILVLYRGDW